jgi:ABC-2 type transport system permease protein
LKSIARTPFAAIFRTEVLLNTKRIAPYVMIALFGGNALLWWGWGPAESRGLATNSDVFIVAASVVFSFMTLPLFTAVIMGDPVIRDFRAGITPIIFSKPISRATYLLGKFFGNFFVLVCCQMAFPLTFFLLQGFSKSRMIVQPARFVPYFKHFLVLIVISHLVLAAIYFTIGTLTRNAKIVYGLAVSFYPLYIAYQSVVLKNLSPRWRMALDPLLMNWSDLTTKGQSAEWLNRFIFSYDPDMLANRASMILIAVVCLTILYLRFSMVERFEKSKDKSHLTTINLVARDESFYGRAENLSLTQTARIAEVRSGRNVALPKVRTTNEGIGAKSKQLMAAFVIELRLLFAERSIVVFVPLATLLCVAGLVYYEAVPVGSYSAAYAERTAESLLLFLCAIAVFYTGEAMHRDRELRFEPVLWSMPVTNSVLLLSKFAATLLLSIFLCLTVGLAAIALQIYKGHWPVEVSSYLIIYFVILMPGVIFLISVVTMFNVLLREKYLAYAVSLGVGIGLFYLYSQGYNHWLYNPLLYGIWTPADVTGAGSKLSQIIIYRIYCLAIAIFFLSLAHLFFERRSTSRRTV